MTEGRAPRDLRDLPPPEPIEIVLAAVGSLSAGEALHYVLRHEPVPLLGLLAGSGLEWRVEVTAPGEVHLRIWREGAREAGRAADDGRP